MLICEDCNKDAAILFIDIAEFCSDNRAKVGGAGQFQVWPPGNQVPVHLCVLVSNSGEQNLPPPSPVAARGKTRGQ